MSRADGPAFAATRLRAVFRYASDQRDATSLSTCTPSRLPNTIITGSASEGIGSLFRVNGAEDERDLHSLFDCLPNAFGFTHSDRARSCSFSPMDSSSVVTSHSSRFYTAPGRDSYISFSCNNSRLDGRRFDDLGHAFWHRAVDDPVHSHSRYAYLFARSL